MNLLPFSYSPVSLFLFVLLLSLYPQADGLKEADYLVAVGDTDCKWMGVSEVMKLLKDVDEEGVDIKVISMMDSSIQAMVTSFNILTFKRAMKNIGFGFSKML